MQGIEKRPPSTRLDRVRLTRDAIVVCGVVLNLILSAAVRALGLPLYLDTVGTIVVAWECGPLAAILTALASNLLCLPFSQMSVYFEVANICVAISASRMMYREVFKRKGGFVLFTLTLSLISGVLGALVAWSLSTVISVEVASVPFIDRIVDLSLLGKFPSMLLVNLALNLVDKFATAGAALLIVRALPPHIRTDIQSLSRSDDLERFDMNRQHRRLLAAITVGAVALTVVCAWISVVLYRQNTRRERLEVAKGAAQQVVNAVDARLVDIYLELGYGRTELRGCKAHPARDTGQHAGSGICLRLQDPGGRLPCGV